MLRKLSLGYDHDEYYFRSLELQWTNGEREMFGADNMDVREFSFSVGEKCVEMTLWDSHGDSRVRFARIELETNLGRSFSWGRKPISGSSHEVSETESDTLTWSTTLTVKPGETKYFLAMSGRGKLNIPYVSEIEITLKDGNVLRYTEEGRYEGVNYSTVFTSVSNEPFKLIPPPDRTLVKKTVANNN